ncbi:MAG: 50S ribosomal protein L31 [Candidatus Shikimatogenerans sp. JK-2022]|nr:50S ribosomal protein L31 [Candidatus Shikimatogenerans bostrichidophilus]
MKKKEYKLIIFQDINNKKFFLTKSTLKTKKKIKINNKIYPLYKVDITKYSHPFFIGNKKKTKKIKGRIEKFQKKYKNFF